MKVKEFDLKISLASTLSVPFSVTHICYYFFFLNKIKQGRIVYRRIYLLYLIPSWMRDFSLSSTSSLVLIIETGFTYRFNELYIFGHKTEFCQFYRFIFVKFCGFLYNAKFRNFKIVLQKFANPYYGSK